MPIYEFACSGCGVHHDASLPVERRDEAPACPACGGLSDRVFTAPEVYVRGGPLDLQAVGKNCSGGRRTNAQQERANTRAVETLRRMATEKRRDRARKDDGDMQLIGSIPRELFVARQLSHGKNYWTEGGKDALKRDDIYFGE